VDLEEEPDNWRDYAQRLLLELGLPCRRVLLVAGSSPQNPKANQRLELMVFEESFRQPASKEARDQ
jgi:pyruvate kinase